MVQTFSLKLPKKRKILVKEFEKVTLGSILAEGKDDSQKETLSIAQVFKISPSQIFKVLVKKVGDKVKKGEVLARKAGVLSKAILRSPINGRLVEVSQALGEITLAGEEGKSVIKSPVSGKIGQISETEMKIEFEGMIFEGKNGKGDRVLGKIENLPPEVGLLDISSTVIQKILVAEHFSRPVLAKVWALEAAGVVGVSFASQELVSASLTIEKKNIQELRGYQGKNAILEPQEKRLIVLLE